MNTEKKLIYITEDDEFLSKIFEMKFKSSGFDIMTFENGDLLLQTVEEKIPHIFLLDFFLPGKNGLVLMGELKQNPKTKIIPVVLVSNNDSDDLKKTALEQGAHDYICKANISIQELIERVATHL